MEHCDNKRHGALSCQGPWSSVMTGVMEHCDDMGMNSLMQWSWSIAKKGVMDHCDERGHGAL